MPFKRPFTRETAEGLDFLEADELLQENGIPIPENLQTLKELKKLLIRKLSENEISETNAENWNEGIRKVRCVLERDKAMRQDLSEIYISLLRLLNCKAFEEDIKDELFLQYKGNDDEFDRIEEMLSMYNQELVNQDCLIVVAGETGAGKSSFLNLLIGEEVLPYSVLSTTSTICRLVNSEEKKYVVQFREKNSEGSRSKEETLATNCSGETLREKLDQYVCSRDRDKPSLDVQEVTICWPMPILQGNVSIVDTPGIGESPEMTEQLLQFLPRAVAFVYVINSANAGGVQFERLVDLLKRQSEIRERQYLHVFDPFAALFVCNQ